MGGPNKLLLPYDDTTVVSAVVRTLLDCGLDVVVVTGRDADDVRRAVGPARTIHNPDFEKGLGTSIAAGVRAVPVTNAVLIALGDMPALREDVVNALVTHASSSNIVVPRYIDDPDTPSHPVLFGSAFRQSLTDLRGDKGAMSVIKQYSSSVMSVPVSGSLHDIDDPSHT